MRLAMFAAVGLVGLSGCSDDAVTPGVDADTGAGDVALPDGEADGTGDVSPDSGTDVASCVLDEDCAGVLSGLDQCERAACNRDTGVCVVLARADGESCTDRNACTENDRCDNGLCKSIDVVTCADDNPCTTDRCDVRDGCVFEPNSARCDDGSVCTTDDTCDDRRCVGRILECDDDNACTEDSCDPERGCVSSPLSGACTDGDPCTSDEVCVEGRCVGEPVAGCVGDVCGDGRCGLDESCTSCAGDCATCCDADEVVDCTGSCSARAKVGDGSCQLSLQCAATAWDRGDCPVTCAPGELEDCSGRCMAAVLVGDGECHDGADGEADFSCAAFGGNDGGDCALCEGDEIADCDEVCVPLAQLGDGVCDARLDCLRLEGDAGDCCGAGELRSCGASGVATCVDAGWVGDAICDDALNCAEHGFDGGDCTTLDGCGEGGIGDCAGVCRDEALLGDGACHRGEPFVADGADFFCALYAFDGSDCASCDAQELAACDGTCRADTRGDGTCDLALDCDKADFDGGDCCPAGQRRDCRGECEVASWIGDGTCDAVFECLAFGYDGGDCARCDADEIFDCNGECVADTLLGDGSCDDGKTARPDLRCDFFASDGGDCAACPAGLIPSCDGVCISATRLGDGTCDAELACPKWELDRADCCGKDEIRNCERGCTDVRWVSDLQCDEVLDCLALGYDGGDCTSCGPNEVSDCNGSCYADAPLRRGDGQCDGGAAGLDLNCAAFDWDGGDCAQCASGSVPACGAATCLPDTIGDLVCDVALDCRKYGRDDCCGAGEIANCVGSCSPSFWVGDGVCDAALDCPGRSRDGGDCQ